LLTPSILSGDELRRRRIVDALERFTAKLIVENYEFWR